ncbi:uncharacterized protein MCYG_05932 [Microsporum canis CBS 113480]|uniref:Uncharacterized protein n=1 Tax=Arthroderma otae (strain ATCC MYA-4605 / CBS 113480) TaxID=554155 RepID=C5FTB0_ARTOC|nr:uncharacterized protein MCYG_05932 [Microsporum canis CBS 113480]EEQ33113.1 predicted protein [Microsporum canis CBS 113480]
MQCSKIELERLGSIELGKKQAPEPPNEFRLLQRDIVPLLTPRIYAIYVGDEVNVGEPQEAPGSFPIFRVSDVGGTNYIILFRSSSRQVPGSRWALFLRITLNLGCAQNVCISVSPNCVASHVDTRKTVPECRLPAAEAVDLPIRTTPVPNESISRRISEFVAG